MIAQTDRFEELIAHYRTITEYVIQKKTCVMKKLFCMKLFIAAIRTTQDIMKIIYYLNGIEIA